MTRPPFEVADIVRRHGERFLETHRAWVTGLHRRVLRAIAQCRTAALGGHRDRCEQCAHPAISFNSCRDRHCPKCLTAARNAWVAAREAELLPVGYVHIVFTVPEPLARLALANKRVVYDLLFRAVAATLLQVAANPKRLGAAIGGLMVLHTWGQRLQHHPHVHCVVPTGGLAPDGTRWLHARPRFFLPIPVLRKLFRGKARRQSARSPSRRTFRLSWSARPAETGRRLPGLRAIALSSTVGCVCQATIRQPVPRAPLPRPLHPPGGDLQPPPRRCDGRHRLVSVERLSTRQPSAHAHPRVGGVSPPLPPPRPPEALRAHSLLRLPRVTLSDRPAPQCRRALAAASAPPPATPAPPRSWPCPRCGAPMRVIERLTPRQIYLTSLLADILHDTS